MSRYEEKHATPPNPHEMTNRHDDPELVTSEGPMLGSKQVKQANHSRQKQQSEGSGDL
ncbi:small acid-soluble spore protein P [Marinicrinis lubricantis]|uniref:Small acid-soluble spore protein P n=1 Tax=Marinicrinis lubricantis TaxID=2086470 RepID=A0ABW1IK67_9BACL